MTESEFLVLIEKNLLKMKSRDQLMLKVALTITGLTVLFAWVSAWLGDYWQALAKLALAWYTYRAYLTARKGVKLFKDSLFYVNQIWHCTEDQKQWYLDRVLDSLREYTRPEFRREEKRLQT
jgi:hypothetical protein